MTVVRARHSDPARRVRRVLLSLLRHFFLILVAAIALGPIIYAAFASLKPLPELLASGSQLFPETWSLENYARAWEAGGFDRYFINSITVTGAVIVLDVIGCSMLGYVLSRRLVPGSRIIIAVLGAALFVGTTTATLFPQYEISRALGLPPTIGMILVIFVGLTLIHTFLIKAFCDAIPPEIEEAAALDGSSVFGTWRRIMLPLMTPMIATVVLLGFQAAWNNFQVPYVFALSSPELRTLTVGVYALRSGGEGVSAYDLMLAGAMIALVPVIILFLFLQRYFIRGLAEGAVKG